MGIKIFCDNADLHLINKFNKKKIVKGFTTNPSLMRKSGAKNYELYSKQIIKECKTKPLSLEVFADDLNLMINLQCHKKFLYSLDYKFFVISSVIFFASANNIYVFSL